LVPDMVQGEGESDSEEALDEPAEAESEPPAES